MKIFSYLLLVALGARGTACFPGMGATMKEIGLVARDQNSQGSTELLGDLLTLPDRRLTRSGRHVKELLSGRGHPESEDRNFVKHGLNGWWCRFDTCCVWQHIADDLEVLFRGDSGRCTRFARQAVRLGFHDAGTWSKATSSQGGGADGSIILTNELSRVENSGMSEMGDQYRAIYARYRNELGYTSVTMADLLQFGSSVATVVCPLGPRIRTWVGRPDSTRPAPENLLPSPFGDAVSLMEMFQNKTISPRGLVALLGSHTTSQQHFVNTTRPGDPQDSTPGVWDNLYFKETMNAVRSPQRVYTLPSDANLANHETTRRGFALYAGRDGQRVWNRDYAREAIRLSLLGVNNINTMTECTRALPRSTHSFRNRDQRMIDRWLERVDASAVWRKISRFIEDGAVVKVSEEELNNTRPPR
ncbi:hypothetical protein S7711_03356 [Stachybotrys chartarum IBT 7711]|uniref:Peroxidase n=1 Tax=Stachybotrys chartarum (strain CBS 109288 / IBT 7711) TaxID=1280523 RepID=A0A084AUS9_STACB|nr:hypothetical protein S7711_03356 [Stachybotrys chartarum IBT 7711]